MKTLREYHEELRIPDSYDLRLSDMRAATKESGATDMKALHGLYKWAFERGRRYERERLKASKK